MLKFENLSKTYGKNLIIDQASGNIKPGEIIALIGPSGSGKSTLFRILSLLEFPDNGKISMDNNNQIFPNNKQKTPHGYWPKVTMMFQQLFLWPHLTMIDNILLPHLKIGKKDDAFDKKLTYLIDYFELMDYLKRYPNELSLGQRQRIALIRALMLNPTYLLLDEITASLDVEHIQKVEQVLRQEKQNGLGIIVATHLIGFAKTIADHVWFLEKGKFIEQGPSSILVKPETKRFKQFLSLME